ncbi:MAG: lysophospholipid acyltransferase family protein [Roseovarius sp.]
MAKFILANAHRDKLFNNRVARSVLWFIDYVVVASVMGLFRLLPVAWASALGARLGRMFGRIFTRRNQHVRANLTVSLPDRSPAEIDTLAGEVWANAGAVLGEYPNLAKLCNPKRDTLEIEVLEQIPAYTDPSKPAVFVSAHLANWEMMACAIARLGVRPSAMYAPLTNPWLDRMMLDYRRMLGCDLVSRSEGLRAFVDALKSGRSPIMLTDRRVDGGKPIPLFDEDKESSLLPARLALRFAVPLVPVQAERLPGARFRVRFHPPLVPSDPTLDRDNQTVDLARQINEKFEQWITAKPGDWLCTSKIWPSSILRARTDIYEDA